MSGDPLREPGAEDAQIARKVMSRAIRRLNILEFLILGAAGLAATAGGWLVAILAGSAFGGRFGITWLVASLLLFVIPGAVVWTMDKRARRSAEKKKEASETREDSPGRGDD